MRQYYMFGIIVSYDTYNKWKNETSITTNEFINNIETCDDGEIIVDDISCVFYSRENKYLIIGKVINEFIGEPIIINKLTASEEASIVKSVGFNFKIFGSFHYFFVKTL